MQLKGFATWTMRFSLFLRFWTILLTEQQHGKRMEHATVHSYCIITEASLGVFMKQCLLASYAKHIKPTGNCEGKVVSQRRASFTVCLSQAILLQPRRRRGPALVWKANFIGTMWKFLKKPQLSAQKVQKWEFHPEHNRHSHLKKINRKLLKNIRS